MDPKTESNGNWFPDIEEKKQDWFPDTITSENSKFKILIGLFDDVIIVLIIVILFWFWYFIS